jgi:uncharacterized membrane protein
VKQITLLSFLLALILLTNIAFAQVQYYGIDATVNENGRTFVKLVITFATPEKKLNFDIIGKIENFSASSIAGPVNCNVQSDAISFINCNLSLTQDKRTVEMSFETNDFVKKFGDKFYFDGDLSLNRPINQVYTSVKLSEIFRLADQDLSDKISFPQNVTTVSDLGRRIMIVWNLANIPQVQPLRFQFFYEELQPPPVFSIRLRYFAAFGIVATSIIIYLIFRFKRKPEKLILSVLDDYERKVMDVIVAGGGTVNQKRVVQETNLSKAKVSRVVKSLVERGIVEVERLGRTNKLKLIKKKFEI